MTTASEIRSKYTEFLQELGQERVEELLHFMVELVIDTMLSIEFLTVIEASEDYGITLTDDEAEFVHDYITSRVAADEVRGALS